MLHRTMAAGFAAAAGLLATVETASAYCVVGVARNDTLNIRRGPSASNPVVAEIPPGACGFTVIGPCMTGWCPVNHRGRTGWVNSYYIQSETLPAWLTGAPPRAAPPVAAIRPPAARPAPARVAARPAASRAEPARTEPARAEAPRPQPASPPPRTHDEPPARAAEARPVPPPAAAPAQPAPSDAVREACVTGIAKGDTLKVRSGPASGAQLRYGFLPDTCGVKITGECKDAWCPVEYRGYRGWAEQRHLR